MQESEPVPHGPAPKTSYQVEVFFWSNFNPCEGTLVFPREEGDDLLLCTRLCSHIEVRLVRQRNFKAAAIFFNEVIVNSADQPLVLI